MTQGYNLIYDVGGSFCVRGSVRVPQAEDQERRKAKLAMDADLSE